ncbi:hypothetical protein JMN32_26600 [Fulvivirga sp. 29W222]|uniref:HTH cro/C1-type domain-containing protein n=1 Tax=Fulvivirga marina TaxID=2494733 RepID=A0A937KEA3_9BACT|nr:bZIP transcription factor [Fulvivirga marina]MBL6449911.1 hypothetical protein [Fulvivirga marina]
MKYKNIIGEKIAFYRNELRLKRPTFIEKLNDLLGSKYSPQALYSWETGKAMPPADLLPPLASLLNISILQLFSDTEVQETDELLEKIDLLSEEVDELKKEVDLLRKENYKLEGKLEASNSILQDMIENYKRK